MLQKKSDSPTDSDTGAAERVLIAGAGPTGLTLALALSRYGVPFSIIDQKPGPTYESKGLALNAPSIYGFELIGHEGIFERTGCLVHRANILWQGRDFSAVDLRHLPFHIQAFVTKPQATTEEELIEALAREGHQVAWTKRLVEVEEGADGVEAVEEDAEGRRTTRRYAYVVGCDGKRSLIRDKIGADFTGPDYDMHFVLGDFEMVWDREPDQVYYFVYPDRFFVFVPITPTLWRVVVKHDGPPNSEAPPTPEEITGPVARYIGPGLFRSEQPSWLSRAQFYTRTAGRMRRGRLFLAGDSAHLVSPIGGTGMNSGMMDALNLAWKLAQVHHGQAGDRLLDTYEPERLEAVTATAMATDRSTRIIGRLDRDEAAIAPFLPRMANRRFLRSVFPLNFSGLALSYRQAFTARGEGPDGAAAPGTAPGDLNLGFGRLRSLLGAAKDSLPPATLLGVVNPGAIATDALGGQLDALLALQDRYRDLLRWCVFLPDDAGDAAARLARAGAIPLAHDPALLRALGVGDGMLSVIRPDAIVGYRGALADPARLAAFIGRYWLPGTREAGQLAGRLSGMDMK